MEFHPTPGSKWSSQLHKIYQCRCTAKNSWWRTERLPETCRVVIPIKLEFSASVDFIHKESTTSYLATWFPLILIYGRFDICQFTNRRMWQSFILKEFTHIRLPTTTTWLVTLAREYERHIRVFPCKNFNKWVHPKVKSEYDFTFCCEQYCI